MTQICVSVWPAKYLQQYGPARTEHDYHLVLFLKQNKSNKFENKMRFFATSQFL